MNNKVVKRNFILVSVYTEDSNTDRFINQKDLRKFYLFNSKLVPENYSVFKSEYDSDNDLMFVVVRLDKNKNGQIDDNEPINIFLARLKRPHKNWTRILVVDKKLPPTRGLALCRRTTKQSSTTKHVASVVSA